MKNGPYILIIAPADFPGKRYRERYCYEHVYVWWKANGTLPDSRLSVVHHKNGNKTDNRLENLELVTRAAHTRGHIAPAKLVIAVCAWCKTEFTLKQRDLKNRRYQKHVNIFCCRSHAVKHQHAARRT